MRTNCEFAIQKNCESESCRKIAKRKRSEVESTSLRFAIFRNRANSHCEFWALLQLVTLTSYLFLNSCLSTEATSLHLFLLVDSLSNFGRKHFTHSFISPLKVSLSSSLSVKAVSHKNSVNIFKKKLLVSYSLIQSESVEVIQISHLDLCLPTPQIFAISVTKLIT